MIGAAREGGWNRVVAVFQPHRYTRTAWLWQDFADAFVDADVVVLTDVYAAGRGAAARGVGPARAARRARRASRDGVGLPAAPRRSARARAAARATGRPRAHARAPATSPPCPTSGWRALIASRVPARRRRARRVRRRPRRRLGAQHGQRDVPIAELTTYRVGGPIAVVVRVRVTRRAAPRVGRGRGRATTCRCSWSGGARTCSSPTRVRRRRHPARRRVRRGSTSTRRRVRAGGAVPLPVLARRTAAAGRPGSSSSSASPVGRRCGADERGRARPRDGRRARRAPRARARRRRAARSPIRSHARPRLPHVDDRPADVVVGAEFRVAPDDRRRARPRSTRSCAGAASTSRAAPNGGLGVPQPARRLRGPAHRRLGLKGLRVGGAVVSEKHANFFQAEPGATADDVLRLIREVQARGPGRDRRRARARAAAGRLRRRAERRERPMQRAADARVRRSARAAAQGCRDLCRRRDGHRSIRSA